MAATRQYGIGLVGALIALLILSSGLLALGLIQTDTLKDSQHSALQAKALILAEQRIDQFRDLAQSQDLEALASGGDTVQADGISYQRNWEVISRADGAREIILRVEWNDPRSPAGSPPARLNVSTVISSHLPATEATPLLGKAPVTLATTTTTSSGGCGCRR